MKVMDGNGTVRPERLLARLKINSVDETGPRLIVVRPPKGPDGSRGFAAQYRMPRIAGEWITYYIIDCFKGFILIK